MDDLYFTENHLTDLAESFANQGGAMLFIDEVHKYPNWAGEIKNIYDFNKDLRIVFTESSIVEMERQDADLSRRAVKYELPGLSYREFLHFHDIAYFQPLLLEELLQKHTEIALAITGQLKPLQYFREYLQYGYYPFFKENVNTYGIRLEQMIKMIVENDLLFLKNVEPYNTRKIYHLLYIMAVNVPFKPNITRLAEKTDLNRNTLVEYLHYLDKARLINTLLTAGKSISILQKPDKIFPENINLSHVLAWKQEDKGTQRETFFLNQLSNAGHQVTLPKQGDFLVNEKYTFEIGGSRKQMQQIRNIQNSYVLADGIATGALNRIPLWLFGFLY